MRSLILCHHLIMKSTIDVPKKSRGRPAVESDRVVVRVQQPDLGAIDAFSKDGRDISRQEAIRLIVRDWLIGHGYLSEK